MAPERTEKMTIHAIQVFTPEDCRYGLCDCDGAKDCKFPRCDNCDGILDAAGRWIEDNRYHGEHVDRCPTCGGPLDGV